MTSYSVLMFVLGTGCFAMAIANIKMTAEKKTFKSGFNQPMVLSFTTDAPGTWQMYLSRDGSHRIEKIR